MAPALRMTHANKECYQFFCPFILFSPCATPARHYEIVLVFYLFGVIAHRLWLRRRPILQLYIVPFCLHRKSKHV